VTLLALTATASKAVPILWSVDIPFFNNDGAVTGTFVFDADQGPSGTISDIKLVSQGGSTFPGPNPYYDMIPAYGIYSAGNGRLFLVADNSLQSLVGQLEVNIGWYQAGVLGLTDAGDEVQNVSVFENVCANPDCTSVYGGPERYGYFGVFTATAIPEPGTWVSVSLLLLLLHRRLRRGPSTS
jgi:hypothetical protein